MMTQKVLQISKRKIFRDFSKCILCGRCRNICPTKAIKFSVKILGICTHCNLCAEICPVRAIESFEGKITQEEFGKPYFNSKSYKERIIKEVKVVFPVPPFPATPIFNILFLF